MARIIRKVIQKRLNSKGDKQYIFDSSSSRDIVVKKQPVLNRKVENVKRVKRILSSDEFTKTKKVNTNTTRFEHRINRSVNNRTILNSESIKINDRFRTPYNKIAFVDYDVVIVITSYNRFKKVYRIIKQLFTQKTEYTFKVILLNDGSTEGNYNLIKEEFPEIDYIKNDINGGKRYYWKTVTKLWNKVSDYETYAMCQIDDDLILCKSFINRIMLEYFKNKEINNRILGVHYHPYWYYGKDKRHKHYSKKSWQQTKIVTDGGTIFDIELIKIMNYSISEISQSRWNSNPEATSYVWVLINNEIKKQKCQTIETYYAYAWHDGNYDSKLNTEVRKRGGHVFTDNFIDGNDIQFEI